MLFGGVARGCSKAAESLRSIRISGACPHTKIFYHIADIPTIVFPCLWAVVCNTLAGQWDGNVAESGSFPSILRQFVAREYGNAALARRSPSIGALFCCEIVRISGHFGAISVHWNLGLLLKRTDIRSFLVNFRPSRPYFVTKMDGKAVVPS